MPHIAVAGVSGKVGDGLRRFCPEGTRITGLIHRKSALMEGLAGLIEGFDITQEQNVNDVVRTLSENGVRTIINCVGQIDLDGVEAERHAADPTALSAYQMNTRSAHLLAKACAASAAAGRPLLLLHLSSESVFPDNAHGKKYSETDEPGIPGDLTGATADAKSASLPTWYGITKTLGERKVLESYRSGSVVVRMHGVQGPRGGFFARTVAEICTGKPFTRVSDMYVAHLTDATIAKAIFSIEAGMHDPERNTRGIYHLSARTACTPYEMALRFAQTLGRPGSLITPILLEELIESSRKSNRPLAQRPHYTILGVSKFESEFNRLPTAEESVDEYLNLYRHLFV